MIRFDLNGTWKLRRTDETEWIEAKVPGSVVNDWLNAGKMADPFYRDNEDRCLEMADYDYEYQREFEVEPSLLEYDHLQLCCEGLDTLAEIKLNDNLLGNTDNMHRIYEWEIKPIIHSGTNIIHIVFHSPLKYIAEKQKQQPTWGGAESVAGFQHLRKAHYMFGWDWGPMIPDLGIWRNISIKGYRRGKLDDLYITQNHLPNQVSLDLRVRKVQWSPKPLTIAAEITGPDGRVVVACVETSDDESRLRMEIDQPELWWPNGYGKQPLYQVEVSLKDGPAILDSRQMTIGLRTLTVKRNIDQWGESFAFEINGIAIFAMGANYIPEDSLLSRCGREKTERLIRDCVAANFNCLRVWGGGIYCEDYFYDLCDRYGLIVWQDLMFACAVYVMTGEFAANIQKEAEDNIKRIRHHACLGLWCGNNEMELAWVDWDFPKTAQLRADYVKQFEIILPEVAKETDPNTFYWPASPSSGGGFEDPNNENRGDVHYWDVWHGLKPFTDYRRFYFRFVSEFGFQSFPGLKTVESFTAPEDRNIFSYIMEKHQKNQAANGKILYYLSANFKYPKDFDSLLYISQILQAEAIKYGVEHWRRNRGRCMGTLYWQLNDCWPVASWSGIDYYGRWKALHYFAKRFFAPVLLSACEAGTNISLHITNDGLNPVQGEIRWRLRDHSSTVLEAGTLKVRIAALTSEKCLELDFGDRLPGMARRRESYLEYMLTVNGVCVSSGNVLFVKPKHFEWMDPRLETRLEEKDDHYIVSVTAKALAKYVELQLEEADCRFSDNYFDISAGQTKTVLIRKDSLPRELDPVELEKRLSVRSLFDAF
jgi:beta-mannosidase